MIVLKNTVFFRFISTAADGSSLDAGDPGASSANCSLRGLPWLALPAGVSHPPRYWFQVKKQLHKASGGGQLARCEKA